jgi:hypothetical protein
MTDLTTPIQRQLLARQIRTDGGTQPRAEINREAVQDYADNMTRGRRFPPVDVFYDGKDYWLADGFHRHAAHMAARGGDEVLAAEIHQGTQRDAVLFSVGANDDHGLRRSNEDKRRAVTRLLKDEEWGKWSDAEIGRRCKVSHPFVAKVRAELIESGTVTCNISSDERTYTTKHGTTATMNTAAIGNNQPTWAAISELERHVRERLPYATGGRDLAEHLEELGRIKQGGKGGWEFDDLCSHVYGLTNARKGDLWQAVNNVHDQIRWQLAEREKAAETDETASLGGKILNYLTAIDKASTFAIAQAIGATHYDTIQGTLRLEAGGLIHHEGWGMYALGSAPEAAALEATAPPAPQFVADRTQTDRAQDAAPLAAKIAAASDHHVPRLDKALEIIALSAENWGNDPRIAQIRAIRGAVEKLMITAKDIDNGGTDSQLFFALNRACLALDGATAVLSKGGDSISS